MDEFKEPIKFPINYWFSIPPEVCNLDNLKLILFSLIFGIATIEVFADVINVVINGQHEMIQKQTIRRMLYMVGIPIEITLFITNVLVYQKTGIVLF
jgi:hypothetical protein